MSQSDSKTNYHWLTTKRIEALADGIFAIAMTLLVLNLSDITDPAGMTDKKLVVLLIDDGQKFFNYALAFLLLSILWISHHRQFHQIKHSDPGLLWINIFILMFVVLMPFSTSLVGDFSNDPMAGVLFAGNYLVITLLYLANWNHATRDFRLIDSDTAPEIISQESKGHVLAAVVSIIVIVLSFFIPGWSLLAYLLLAIYPRIGARSHNK